MLLPCVDYTEMHGTKGYFFVCCFGLKQGMLVRFGLNWICSLVWIRYVFRRDRSERGH